MIVLDACAAVEIVEQTERGQAYELLIESGEPIISSELFQAEIRNAYWKYVRAGVLAFEQAQERIVVALGLVDAFVAVADNGDEAFLEAARTGHSVYDMLYLTLARRRAATLMSSDKRLNAVCDQLGVSCVSEVFLDD